MATRKKTGGRQKGAPNKLGRGAKLAIETVFTKLGGPDAMAKWAKENQTEFYRLYARLLPHEVTGPEGGPIATSILVSFVSAKG